MYQLTYASEYQDLTTPEIIEGIVKQSKIRNMKENITGILVFNSGYFLQCLEGESSSINKIFQSIANDNRHFNVTLLTYEKVSAQNFPFWSMASVSDITSEFFSRYNLSEFNPFKIERKMILPFLKKMGIVYSERLALN